ncbi:MAG: DEAD/DEAH box helicase [Gemmatimonadales bacterium]
MDGLGDAVLPELVDPTRVRAAIASAVISSDSDGECQLLGSIALHAHQVQAVHRLRGAIDEFGGAFLCDPVGTGKTFTALALAAPNTRVLVVAPAVLRPMWTDAARRANRLIAFVSFESLSRGASNTSDPSILIVDEAHHARNPSTRRFGSLSRLATGKEVLLMSATPIHNKRGDLTALLSLFLGTRAERLSAAELGRCVLRRDKHGLTAAATPQIERLRWLPTAENETLLNMILALPPPLPPSDGGDGGVLVTHSLIRQWASSDGALRSGIVRRLQRAIALIAALEDGVYPSRSDLNAWRGYDDSVQLTFSSFLARPTGHAEALLPIVRAHQNGLSALLRGIKSNDTRDSERARIVRRVRSEHEGSRIVAFSQFARTVETMFSHLAADGRVAALTGSGARVAGGRITRAETLQRFAPAASNRTAPRPSEEITLLLTTDLLSEGVNLQDASVVIHLDLPWTPARMEQRLGRVARLGSMHKQVYSYAIRPPACAETLVRTEQILRRKMNEAGIITSAFPSLTDFDDTPVRRSNTAAIEAIRATLSRWMGSLQTATHDTPIASAVAAPNRGFVAVVRATQTARLVASRDGVVSDDPEVILDCLRCADGRQIEMDHAAFRRAIADLRRYLDLDQALIGIWPGVPCTSVVGESILSRVSRIAQRARPHERAGVASLAIQARQALARNFGIDMERRLMEMDNLQGSDHEWLRAIVERITKHSRANTSSDASVLIAMLILQPTNEENALSRATER